MTTPVQPQQATVQGIAGQAVVLDLDFWLGGQPADPIGITLDITYGSGLGGPDAGGPYSYQGAASATPGEIWRTGTGTYSCQWEIPADAESGIYVASWSVTYQGGSTLAVENIQVIGFGLAPLVPAGDVGFWQSGISYQGIDIACGTVDAAGIAWLHNSLDGFDSPPLQGAGVTAKAGDHGGIAAPQFYAPRTMTWTVTASAPNQVLRDQARAQLQQAVPVSDLAPWYLNEPIPKTCYVRRGGQVTEKCLTLCDVEFTIPLTAPDPRKYASAGKTVSITPIPAGLGGGLVVPFSIPFTLAQGAPAGATVAGNDGNFESPPVAVLTGPVAGPSITNLATGQVVSWSTLTLKAGEVAVVDFLNAQTWVTPQQVITAPGLVASGGGTYWPADITSSWWRLQPGDNPVQYGGDSSTGARMDLYYADTWI